MITRLSAHPSAIALVAAAVLISAAGPSAAGTAESGASMPAYAGQTDLLIVKYKNAVASRKGAPA